MVPSETVLQKIMHAIAKAEGFYVSGSRPSRNHNPGDFEYDIIGKGVGKDGVYIIYPDDETGWLALHTQVLDMFNGGSHIYNSKMTILQVAMHYTATAQSAWASIVAEDLGVSVLTRLEELQ